MLLGLTYQLMRFITDLVLVRTRSDAQLRAEGACPPASAPGAGAEGRQARLAARLIASCWLASAACSRSPACDLCYRSRRRCSAGTAIWSVASGRPSTSALGANAQCAPRAAGADSEAGGGEPEMGLPQDSGGDGQARLSDLTHAGGQDPAQPRHPAGSSAQPDHLAQVRPSARRPDARHGLVHG
jgi:hypothetical protein